jgi:spore germination cell wall hydrolase CwlJ-like protein
MEPNNVIGGTLVAFLLASAAFSLETPTPEQVALLPVPAIEVTQPQPTTIPMPPSDQMDAVYRTVYGEVRSQSDTEIAAVTHVIVNRWQKGWATSIKGVVKQCDLYRQACQFSVWNWNDPNFRLITDKGVEKRARFKHITAVVDAVVWGRLNGQVEDTTEGGDHYWHGITRPWWARGHKEMMIGKARIINVRG